jgi:hypothetical protein
MPKGIDPVYRRGDPRRQQREEEENWHEEEFAEGDGGLGTDYGA